MGYGPRKWKHLKKTEPTLLERAVVVTGCLSLLFFCVYAYSIYFPFSIRAGDAPLTSSEQASSDRAETTDSPPFPTEETLIVEDPSETTSTDIIVSVPVQALSDDIPISDDSGLMFVVEKHQNRLTVLEDGKPVREYRISAGKNSGDKQRSGDYRTPEGSFPVVQIQNSSHWAHDFKDGKGIIQGAYGPLFIRLRTPPWTGIGIHGTHDPDALGKNVTEGCIRMQNEELAELAKSVDVGLVVVIKP